MYLYGVWNGMCTHDKPSHMSHFIHPLVCRCAGTAASRIVTSIGA